MPSSLLIDFDPTAFVGTKLLSRTPHDDEETSDQETQDRESGGGAWSALSTAATSNEESGPLAYLRQSTVFVIDCAAVAAKQLPQALFFSPSPKKLGSRRRSSQAALVTRGEASDEESQPTTNQDPPPWREISQAIASYMRGRIIACRFDKCGVVLYGVNGDQSDEENSHFDGVCPLINLDEISADAISTIESMGGLSYSEFQEKYTKSDKPKMSELLWYLKQLLSRSVNKRSFKSTIIFITANDDPVGSEGKKQVEKTAALQRAKDLMRDGVEIAILPLSRDTFQFSIFYAPAFGEGLAEEMAKHSLSLKDLEVSLKRREVAQRSLYRLPMILIKNEEEDLSIGVEVFSSILSQSVPTPVRLRGEDNAVLSTMTHLVCEETGELLAQEQTTHYIEIGSERVYLAKDIKQTVSKLSTDIGPHILVLGFKPRSLLKSYHIVRNPLFLRPDEKHTPHGKIGSARLFAALLTCLHRREQFAVCRYVSRKNTAPRLCALLPQMELIDENDITIEAAGFHLIPLPFANDIRHLDLNPLSNDQNEQRLDLLKCALDKLQLINFDPRDIPNPALQWHYAGLEALALQHEEPTKTVDVTDIEPEGFAVCFDELRQWIETLPTLTTQPEKKSPARKRQTECSVDEASIEDLESFRVVDLKNYLSKHQLPVSGKKAQLVERIRLHRENDQKKGGEETTTTHSKKTRCQ